jgi:hypothetical protein
LLQTEQLSFISDRPVGDTPLEFHPLQAIPSGIIVLSPSNLSVAVRALMVRAANAGSMGDTLQHTLLLKQQEYAESSGFWPVSSLFLSPPNGYLLRTSVCEYAPGRFLHTIQIPATFDGFPARAFGSMREPGPEPSRFIVDDIERFWQFLSERQDFRLGVTVLLLGGWGTPHAVGLPIDNARAPANWLRLPLSFNEAAVLGACEDGHFSDIVRMLQQVKRLEDNGFELEYVNGIVNLFGFWRTTHGNLIPEHLTQIVPPCSISLPINELLAPRREAAHNRDIRALPTVPRGFKITQRLDWGDPSDLRPIYASLDDAKRNKMLGAAFFGTRVWWIECVKSGPLDGDWPYRVWTAILQWLSAIGSAVINSTPDAFPIGLRGVEVLVPPRMALVPIDPAALAKANARAALTVRPATAGIPARVTIAEAWLQQLGAAENDAEVELVAAVLEAVSMTGTMTRANLAEQVRTTINSIDWRWLHVREGLTPLDELVGAGVVGEFRERSFSAHALAKCGSVWTFWDRTKGFEINGESNCKEFLANYRTGLLAELIARVRLMDRQKIAIACGLQYEAARAEQDQWRSTIRAMRAIRGTDADASAFKRQNAINAVLRASKTICELATCEASVSGLRADQADLDELFALALLVVGNGQLFALISAGLHEPTLRISPAGDLMSDHSVHTALLRPSAELMNRRVLDDAAQAYPRRRIRRSSDGGAERTAWTPDLRAAVEAEYRTSVEAFANLQFALVNLAEARREGAFTMRRSDLAAALDANPAYPSASTTTLLERLTLPRRNSWRDIPAGMTASDFNLSRFDRPYSIINRPLVALDDSADPLILVAPLFVSDACMYSLSGLRDGTLNNTYWVSDLARAYAGAQGHAMGEQFEDDVCDRLQGLGLQAWTRRPLSWALNMKVGQSLGNIDVLAVGRDRRRVWVIEAKNLRLCRTETEVASRLSEYRGRANRDRNGRERPDKMLRHIRRVGYLRAHASALCSRLELDVTPEVNGLLVVDAPQPMSFFAAEQLHDGQTVMLDAIDNFEF